MVRVIAKDNRSLEEIIDQQILPLGLEDVSCASCLRA